jgi:hypothetical protein
LHSLHLQGSNNLSLSPSHYLSPSHILLAKQTCSTKQAQLVKVKFRSMICVCDNFWWLWVLQVRSSPQHPTTTPHYQVFCLHLHFDNSRVLSLNDGLSSYLSFAIQRFRKENNYQNTMTFKRLYIIMHHSIKLSLCIRILSLLKKDSISQIRSLIFIPNIE